MSVVFDGNKVTFVCQAPDCNNKRTMYKSLYDNRKRHFCGTVCFYANKGSNSPKKVDKEKPNSIKKQIADYFQKT